MIEFNTGRLWKANRVLRGCAVVQAIRAGLGASYVRQTMSLSGFVNQDLLVLSTSGFVSVKLKPCNWSGMTLEMSMNEICLPRKS